MLSQQRRSRSLEYILGDNTSSSSSYDQLTSVSSVSGVTTTTLPRLTRCDQVPGMSPDHCPMCPLI